MSNCIEPILCAGQVCDIPGGTAFVEITAVCIERVMFLFTLTQGNKKKCLLGEFSSSSRADHKYSCKLVEKYYSNRI